MRRARFLVPLLLGLRAAAGGETVPHQLRIDPFQSPEPEVMKAIEKQPDTVLRARVTAVIRSRRVSMVNLEGTVVAVGENYNGFRLVEVRDRSAVFVRDEKRYTLSFDEEYDEAKTPTTE